MRTNTQIPPHTKPSPKSHPARPACHSRGPVIRFLCTALLILLAACNGRDAANAFDPDTLHIGNGGEPKSLDPHAVTGIIEERLLSALFEGLVNLDLDTLQPIPGAAKSWDVSEDERTYTFHLDESARWSNGDPVTAHDFAFAWRRILSPEYAAEYAYMLYPIENAEAFHRGELTDFAQVGVRTLDDHTLEIRLRAPTPWFFSLQIHFTFYPVHRPTLEAHGGPLERDTPWTRPGSHVSNGPYRLTEWRPNDRIVVEQNPHYRDAPSVRIPRVVFLPIQNPSTEERAFRAGEIQITNALPLPKVAAYRERNDPALRIDPFLAVEFVRFNTERAPFDDPRVRKAFALAIDRQTLVDSVLRGGQRPAASYVPPGTGGYEYGDSPALHRFAPGDARALLADAGYPNGEGFPEVTMIYDTSDNNRIYCEAVQEMWRNHLGVRVQIENMDGKTWLARQMNRDYDLARSFWIADYDDPMNFLDMYLAASGNNRTGFNRTEYDDLIRSAVDQTGPEREATLRRAETLLLETAPITPVYIYSKVYLAHTQLQGLTPNRLGRIHWPNLNWPTPTP
jgi:oligopeptide transport system substrate-binding protein